MRASRAKNIGPGTLFLHSHFSDLLKRFFGLAALILIIVLYAALFANRTDPGGPQAIGGIADFSDVSGFERPVKLVGEWAFRWSPSGPPAQNIPQDTLKVPGEWDGEISQQGTTYRDKGLGSYWLTLTGLAPGSYALHVPVLYGATRVSLDGREVSSAGRIGTSSVPTEYGVRSHTVPIEVRQAPVTIQIDVATSRHRDNGMEEPPVFGPAAAMNAWGNLSIAQDLFLPASLLFSFVFSVVVLVARGNDRPSLFLGLSFIFMVPIILIVAHDNFLSAAIPSLSFTSLAFLQYVCGILAIWLFTAYAENLFYKDRVPFVMAGISAIMTIHLTALMWLLLSGDTYVASSVSQTMYPVRLAIFLYIISLAVRAVIHRREAAHLFLVGWVVLLVSSALRALVTNGYVDADHPLSFNFVTEGVLFFLLMQMVIMVERWSLAIKREEATNRARALAEQAQVELNKVLSEVKGQRDEVTRFLSSASHDLQQPIQAAQLFFDRAVVEPDIATRQRAIEGAGQAFEAAQSLLREMLEHLRLENRAINARLEPVDLNSLLHEIAIQYGALAGKSGILIKTLSTSHQPEGNLRLIKRILGNVVSNAIEHSGGARILIGTRRKGAKILIYVFDDGNGVSPDLLETVFEEFGSHAEEGDGGNINFGLGLFASRRLARAMGGNLILDRQWNCGSCFILELSGDRPVGCNSSSQHCQRREVL